MIKTVWTGPKTKTACPGPGRAKFTARFIQFCKRAGAKLLAFDVLFTEPSKYGVADDQALASEIRSFKHFVGAVFLSRTAGSEKHWPAFAPAPALNIQGLDPWLTETGHDAFPRASFPVAEISAASGVLANVHLNPDVDSVYRRAALFEVFDGKVLPSLALASYLAAQTGYSFENLSGTFHDWATGKFLSMPQERPFLIFAARREPTRHTAPRRSFRANYAFRTGRRPPSRIWTTSKTPMFCSGFPLPVSLIFAPRLFPAFIPAWKFPPRCSTICWPMILSGLFPWLSLLSSR